MVGYITDTATLSRGRDVVTGKPRYSVVVRRPTWRVRFLPAIDALCALTGHRLEGFMWYQNLYNWSDQGEDLLRVEITEDQAERISPDFVGYMNDSEEDRCPGFTLIPPDADIIDAGTMSADQITAGSVTLSGKIQSQTVVPIPDKAEDES